MKKILTAAVVAATTLFAAQANAALFNITSANPSNAFGTDSNDKWRQFVQVTMDGETRGVGAGLFRLEIEDSGGNKYGFDTFCIQLNERLRLPNTYEMTAFDPSKVNAINALWSNAFGQVNNAKTAAAFQFSVWEIMHDTGMDLASGDLILDGRDKTEALAQTWLDKINAGTWTANPSVSIFRFQNDNSQDLLGGGLNPVITTSEVPVPPSVAFMAAALGGTMVLARRRRAHA